MIYLNILLTVKDPKDVDAIKGLLAEASRLCQAEPGCLRWEAYHSTADSARFVLHERWESQAALDQHRKAEAYTRIYQPQILPLVTREAHPSALIE